MLVSLLQKPFPTNGCVIPTLVRTLRQSQLEQYSVNTQDPQQSPPS